MKKLSFNHLSDPSLLQTLREAVGNERIATVVVVALLAEVEARGLHLKAGYPSMYKFCIGEYRLSEQAAYKRIQAARAARRFPMILSALADGRLHLSAVVLLRPHLKPGNIEELVATATHKTKAEVERLLAERFPRPDVPTLVIRVPSSSQALAMGQLSPGIVASEPSSAPTSVGSAPEAVPAEASDQPTPAPEPPPGVAVAAPPWPASSSAGFAWPRVTPIAPERFALQVTIRQETHDKLRRAQDLLSHAVASGDVAEVLDRSLGALIHELEKRKFAATSKPRASASSSANPRYIPAHVKRAVRERDGERCTFVSDRGVRCSSRKLLEFYHVHEVARGGSASISGIRLRCRAHNQYAAECTFGAGFMDAQRRAAVAARAAQPAAGSPPD